MSGPWGKPRIYDHSSTNLVHRGTGISAFVSSSNSTQSSNSIKYRPGDWKNARPLQRCASVSQLQRPANKRPQIQRSSSGLYHPNRFTTCVNTRSEVLKPRPEITSKPVRRYSSNCDVSKPNLRRSGSVSLLPSKQITPPRKISPAPRPLFRSGSVTNIPVRPLTRSGSTANMRIKEYLSKSGSTINMTRSNIRPLSRSMSMSSASVAKRNLTRSGAPNISAEFLRRAKRERKQQEEADKYGKREEGREESHQRKKESRDRTTQPFRENQTSRPVRVQTPDRLVREKMSKSEQQRYQCNRSPDEVSSTSCSPLSSLTGSGLPRGLDDRNKAERARLLRLRMTKNIASLQEMKERHARNLPGAILNLLEHNTRVSPHRLLNKPRQKRNSATTITSDADHGGAVSDQLQDTSKMFSDADSDVTSCDSDFDDIVMIPDDKINNSSTNLRLQLSPVNQQLNQQPEQQQKQQLKNQFNEQHEQHEQNEQLKKRPVKQHKRQLNSQLKQYEPPRPLPEKIKFPVPRPMTYEDRCKLDKIQQIAFQLDRPLTASELYAFYKDPVMKPIRRDRREINKENRTRLPSERLREWRNTNIARGSKSDRSIVYTDDNTPMNRDQRIRSSRLSSPVYKQPQSRKTLYDSMTGRRIYPENLRESEEDSNVLMKKSKKSKHKETEASLKYSRKSRKNGIGIIKLYVPHYERFSSESDDNPSTSNDIMTEEIFTKSSASESSPINDASTLEDTTPLNSSLEQGTSKAPSETILSWIISREKLNHNIIDAVKKDSTPEQLDSGIETTEFMRLSGENTPDGIVEIPINETQVFEDQMKELKMTVEQEVGLHIDLALQSDLFQNVFDTENRTSSKPNEPINYALIKLEQHEMLISDSDMENCWISLESGGPSVGTSSRDDPLPVDAGSNVFIDGPTQDGVLVKEDEVLHQEASSKGISDKKYNSINFLSYPSHDPNVECYKETDSSSSYYENHDDYSAETYSDEEKEVEEYKELKFRGLHKYKEPLYSDAEFEYINSYLTEELPSGEEMSDPQPYHSAYVRNPIGRHSPEQADSNRLTIKPIISTLSESTRILLEKRQQQNTSEMSSLNDTINSILLNNSNQSVTCTAPPMVTRPSFAALMAHSNKNKAPISSPRSTSGQFPSLPSDRSMVGSPGLKGNGIGSLKPSVGSFNHDTLPTATSEYTSRLSAEPLMDPVDSFKCNKMKRGIAFTVDLNENNNDKDFYC